MTKCDRLVTVLHLGVTSIIGGGSEYLYSLVKGIMARGGKYRFVVACPNDGIYFRKFHELGIEVVDLPLRSLRWSNLASLSRMCAERQVDLIHAHGKGAGLYGRIVGLWQRIPVVYTFHGFHYEHYSGRVQKAYLLYERTMQFCTCHYILVSHGEKQKVVFNQVCGNDDKMTVIHNGICDDRINKVAKSRSDFGFSSNDIVISMLSRISRQKGIEYLVTAARSVVDEFPLARFVIVGDSTEDEVAYKGEDAYRDSILEAIQILGLTNNFFILQKRQDALNLVAASDLYVTCSLGEGFSLSLVEAMILGRPIVASDVVGNNEAIHNRVSGLLFPSGDSEALASRIKFLLKHPTAAQEMGRRAREFALAHFSYERMISKTLSVYDRIRND